jgi:hypothetical protein
VSKISENIQNTVALEQFFREDEETFRREFPVVFAQHPDSVVLQVWQQRLFYQESEAAPMAGKVPTKRAELGLVVLLALLAGTIAKLPQFIGTINNEFFYSRNMAFIVMPSLAAYFFWRTRPSRNVGIAIAGIFCAAAVFINLLPNWLRSDSIWLACIHLPAVLWCVTGLAFTGAIKPSLRRWQYLKFNGELIVYTGLFLVGGVALSMLTFGLFSLIGMRIDDWYTRYVVVYGSAAAPLVAAYVVNLQPRLRIAPIVAKVFSPLVLLTLVAYLIAMAIQRKSPYSDREFLLLFNVMLLAVLAIIVFAISGRETSSKLIMGDYIHILLIGVALILDVVALSAIVFRLAEYGFSPNRIAVLGANLVVCGNLAGLLWHYLRFARGKADLVAAESFAARYLTVNALWAALVTFVFPFIFCFQ